MDFLQILDAPIEPGGLVEWIPTVEGGLGGWHRDERLTSHNHENHLRDAFDYRARTQRAGGRESWLGLAMNFAEPMSVPAIRSAIIAWIARHEVLRTHVVLDGDRTERYSTGKNPVRVKMTRIGWYAEQDMLLEQIAGSFDRATAPLHWPAYRFATVARGDSFTLLFAADHSLVDGYSLVTAQYELTELYRAARDRRPAELPEIGSYVDFSNDERVAAETAADDHRAVQVWRDFLTNQPFPEFVGLRPAHERAEVSATDVVGPASNDADHPPQTSRTSLLLDDAQTRGFEAAAIAAGGNLVSGVLAALALAYRQIEPNAVFSCVMPRHTRSGPTWYHSLGWFVGLAPVAVDVTDGADFPTATRRAAHALSAGRPGASLPFLRIAELLRRAPRPTFVVSFMDTRHTPTARYADSGGARVLRSHSYAPDEVYVWVNRTPSGLRLHSRFPSTRPDRVLRFLQDFADLLASTGQAG